jgi:hypothetical protein
MKPLRPLLLGIDIDIDIDLLKSSGILLHELIH